MEQLQQIVTQEVKDCLPDVLIDYLWSLALTRAKSESSMQIFTLTPKFLGVGNIQNITQEIWGQNDLKQYRVFGIKPVNQVISIHFDDYCYKMSISS